MRCDSLGVRQNSLMIWRERRMNVIHLLCAPTSTHIFCMFKNVSVFPRVSVDARRTSDQRQSKATAPPNAAAPSDAAPRVKKNINVTVYHSSGYTASAAPRCAAPRNESWEKFIFHGAAFLNARRGVRQGRTLMLGRSRAHALNSLCFRWPRFVPVTHKRRTVHALKNKK